ncbi:hypothetical protein ACH5RR_037666 [Cinchona calisaya]|uniref:RING-type E3 ubiquitin transferase n=1 Tax=Cinchona calisaya TaxID=153742 RepID=A0ABD2Y6V4_9GENT
MSVGMKKPSFTTSYWYFHVVSAFYFIFSLLCTTTNGFPSDPCASIVPRANITARAHTGFPILEFASSYYWGGEKIFGDHKKSSGQFFNSSDVPLTFYTTGDIYETKTIGTYRIQAYLRFRLPYSYSNYSGYGQNYHPRRSYRRRSLRFFLSGFFSENSRKLCMVGKASWQPVQGKPLELDAVFELNYAHKNATILTSLAKGSLKSLSSSSSLNYFDPIEIVSFPILYDYNYTLASKGLGRDCLGRNDVVSPKQPALGLQPKTICSMFSWRSYEFELEYAEGCKNSRDCSPFERDTAYLTLYAFQCLEDEEKLRFLVAFQNRQYSWTYQSFDPNTTLIGEGSWDGEKNQLCIVACRILDPYKSLQDVRVGDCSMRLRIRFLAVWTIKDSSISNRVGLMWTNKTGTDPGYFKDIKLSSSQDDGVRLPGLRYEYTQIDKAIELCPKKEFVKKIEKNFPKGNSYDMRFDMSVRYFEEEIGWGNGMPVSINDQLYGGNSEIIVESDYGEVEESTSYGGRMNISYKIIFYNINLRKQFSSLNSSVNRWGQLVMSAEGVYDAETGHLCMVGCRELHQNTGKRSLDCEIFIDVEFPPLNSRVGRYINGTIQSRRPKTDDLYFEQLNISSSSFYAVQAQESLWRMDLEIIMVLISNTLACIFVASQLFYVKKHPEILPFISFVMLTILTLGHMIPLVLNLEALLLKNHDKQNVILRGDGWLELNEVSLRLVTLVVFLLLLRLLQLAWTARTQDGNGHHLRAAERKTLFVCLLLYAVGGLITFLVELEKNGNGNGNGNGTPPAAFSDYTNSTISEQSSATSQQSYALRYLKSYAGLVLDGFLFPQIIFNIFQNSREKSLSCSFYIGTTLVRLLPHAYDLYRYHNYIRQDFYGSYIYANHSADFYSIAWDVIILCGCVVFAVIIWLQQRFGGSYIVPQRIRELGMYEKVPVVSTE